MNAVRGWLSRLARGAAAARLFEALGIDPRRYWLLMDLFALLSERRELMGQLGRDGVGLKVLAWLYFAMSAFMALILRLAGPPPQSYLTSFLGITAFLLAMVLLPEIAGSLMNPAEGLAMAHQPVDGATYTAAKLSHLFRIILYLVPGMNAVAAVAGVTLPGAHWSYPIIHMLAAFGTGLVIGLSGCAIFGWLLRLVAPARLKTAGQIAELLPLPFVWGVQLLRPVWERAHAALPPAPGAARLWLGGGAAAFVAVLAVFGLRGLSGDYLAKAAAIAHGSSGAKSRPRRSRIGALVAACFGGPGSRAGFEFVSGMILRDWQARRNLLLQGLTVVFFARFAFQGLRTSPFSGHFSAMHMLPHLFGAATFMVCSLLPYGNDYKGAWVFQSAPTGVMGPFARGVFAWLWIKIVIIPHILLSIVLAWYWGVRDALLFTAFSLSCASFWLGAELRSIDGPPFSKQPEGARNAMMLPTMILGGLAMGVAVGVQYLLVFRSPAMVAAVTAALAAGAYSLTRRSLDAFETAIRYSLGQLSGEATVLYREIDG